MRDVMDSGGVDGEAASKGKWVRKIMATGAAAALAISAFGIAPSSVEAQGFGETPQYHEVRTGDTLWDLSGRYYGDNYSWPRMWSYNAHITNPHWIYPGDIVYLQTMDPEAVERAAYQEIPEPQEGMLGHADSVGLYMAQGGMMTEEALTSVGRIIGSPKEARMLAETDNIWVGFGEQAYTEEERESLGHDEMEYVDDIQASEGDRFAIIRKAGELEGSEGETLGHKYYVVGAATITEVPQQEGVAKTAIIDKSWREVLRGDLLVPYERQLQLVQPREADQDLVAQIVDSIDPSAIFGPLEYVFVNRGAEHGVRAGNRFFVYQQWEGFEHPHEESAPEIPWQQVGQLMVINVTEHYSLAVVTRASREVLIGDRLEMYTGY